MRSLARNFLGETVFQGEDGSRFLRSGKSILSESDAGEISARFLRIRADDPESLWLCALAFAFAAPGSKLPLSDFFTLCAPKGTMPGSPELKALSRPFLQCASIAFFRRYAMEIDGRFGSDGLRAAIARHAESGLADVQARSSRIASFLSPLSLGLFRLALGELGILSISLPFSHFNPAEGLLCRASLSDDSAAPWPLSFASGLAVGLTPSVSAFPGSEPLFFAESLAVSLLPDGESLAISGWPESLPWAGFPLPKTLSELAARQAALAARGSQSKLAYAPLSRSGPGDATTPLPLAAAQSQARADALLTQPDWDRFVCSILGFASPSEMALRLSPEQIDACGLALLAFQRRGGFILADETGLGKGRILAALARAFLRTGRRVVFVTERRSLFTDFWRDILATDSQELASEPFLLHPLGKIFSQDGELLFKAKGKTAFSKSLQDGPGESNLVLTTYSQFSRERRANPRWQFLEECVKGEALLILDEAHNAAGASNTRENFLEIIAQSKSVLFSSATFAKHEEALSLYGKAIPISSAEMELMLSSLPDSQDHTLARAISQGLTQTGYLIRREHPEDSAAASQLVDLAEDGPSGSFIREQRQFFSEALEALFRFSRSAEQSRAKRGDSSGPALWARMGALLARLARQHNLLCKIEEAARFAKQLFLEGNKPIFALESTFESFLLSLANQRLESAAYADDFEDSQNEETESSSRKSEISLASASFADLMRLAVDSIAPESLLLAWGDPDPIADRALALASLSPFQALPASPLDWLAARLRDLGMRSGEISGRSLAIGTREDGSLFAHPLSLGDREAIIRQFNHGDLDSLIITRAGSTGLSLHSDASFSDQRPRAFVELEVSPNPTVRIQFLGRVRRRGQVVPPSYFCLTTGAPFERRQFERAQRKQSRLSGMTSAIDAAGPASFSLAERLISPTGDRLALEWLSFSPDAGLRMGLDPGRMAVGDAEGPCERLLKRLPLLSAAQQDAAFDFLLAGLAIDASIEQRRLSGFARAAGAVLARKTPFWGTSEAFAAPSDPFSRSLWAETWIAPNSSASFGSARAHGAMEQARLDLAAAYPSGIGSFLQSASCVPSPQSAHFRRNLLAAAPYLRPGGSIRFTDPAGPRVVEAMILRAELADSRFPLSPSLWFLEVAIPGESQSLRLSLGTLFSDPQCYFETAPSWPAEALDRQGDRPLSFLSVSGHCVYSRWWLKRSQAGRAFSFSDSFGSIREQPIIDPFRVNSLSPSDWRIPLLNFRLAARLLQSDPRLALSSAFLDSEAAPAILRASNGAWQLSLSFAERERVSDFALDRKLGSPLPPSPAAPDRLSFRVSSRDLHSVLAMLQTRGVFFFAPASRRNWHAGALAEILSSRRAKSSGKSRR